MASSLRDLFVDLLNFQRRIFCEPMRVYIVSDRWFADTSLNAVHLQFESCGHEVLNEHITSAHDAAYDKQIPEVEVAKLKRADVVVAIIEDDPRSHALFGVAIGLNKPVALISATRRDRDPLLYFHPLVKRYFMRAEHNAALVVAETEKAHYVEADG